MIFNEFEVRVDIKENKIFCEIILPQHPDCQLKYAFYLLLNGNKIDTKSYSDSNIASFQLIEDGQYQVMGFVMQGTERFINRSQSMEFVFDEQYPVSTVSSEEHSIPISIFGSCVSRDLLEYDRSNKINLKTYIARQSIISAVSKPINIELDDIDLKSNFQRRCVYNDFKKNMTETFKSDGSKYLLIDLIDERFKLVRYEDDEGVSIVTYSTYLQESSYIKDPNLIDKKKCIFNGKKYYVDDVPLEEYLKEFCEKISGIYPEECIIIHKCKMSQFYIDKQGKIIKFNKNYLYSNKLINKLLDYMYSYLECHLPKAKVINICDKYCADETHKWGLAPMHYQEEYYLETIKLINKYLLERK